MVHLLAFPLVLLLVQGMLLTPSHPLACLRRTWDAGDNIFAVIAGSMGRPVANKTKNEPLIHGGKSAQGGEIPWQGALLRRDQSIAGFLLCGAVLISPSWLLTAASCGQPDSVSAGILNRPTASQGVPIERWIPHELFESYREARFHDIALIKVSRPFLDVQPIDLSQKDQEVVANEPLTVSGWGVTEDGILAGVLKKATIYPVDLNTCHRRYEDLFGNGFRFPDNQFCAQNPKTDVSKADIGGPVFRPTSRNRATLVGIVSWFKDPDQSSAKYPRVFTDVAKYIDWIEGNINTKWNDGGIKKTVSYSIYWYLTNHMPFVIRISFKVYIHNGILEFFQKYNRYIISNNNN